MGAYDMILVPLFSVYINEECRVISLLRNSNATRADGKWGCRMTAGIHMPIDLHIVIDGFQCQENNQLTVMAC